MKFSCTLDEEGTPFSVVHSVCHEAQNKTWIEAVFLTVTKNEKEEEKREEEAMEVGEGDQPTPTPKSAFITTLHWITVVLGKLGPRCYSVGAQSMPV